MKKLQNFLVYLMYLGVVCFIRKGKSSCVSPAVCDLTPAEVTHELNLSREKGRGSEKGKETPQRETVRRRPGCGRTVQKKINSCFLHLTAFPCPKGRMGTRVGVRRSERDGRVCVRVKELSHQKSCHRMYVSLLFLQHRPLCFSKYVSCCQDKEKKSLTYISYFFFLLNFSQIKK